VTNNPSASTDAPTNPAPVARLWRWARIILVLAMLIALVWLAKPARIARALANADYLLALAAVPAVFAAALLDALRLHCLMKPQGYLGGWRRVLRTNLVVNFLSQFLPGTIGGGAVAWVRLSRPQRLYAQTFTALALNTLLKFVAMCAVGAAALAADAHSAGRYNRAAPLLAACALAPLILFFLMLHTRAAAWMKKLCQGRPARLLPKRISDALRKIIESLEAYRNHHPALLLGLTAGIARCLVSALPVIACLHAVGITGVPYARVLWIMALVEASGMLPFTLSGIGMPQVTFVGLMAASGIAEDKAVAASIISWAALLPLMLTGAAIMLWESLHPTTPSSRRTHDPAP